MIIKSSVVHILVTLLLLHYVSGHKIRRNVNDNKSNPTGKVIEESDRLLATQTGCKYLAVKNDETVLFTKVSGNLQHTTMALLTEETPADQKPKFDMHFAIKSTADLHVLLFTRRHYMRTSPSEADYEIALGTDGNTLSHFFYTALSDTYENFQSYDLKNTSQILSADKYEKFYITITDGTLKYGKHCDSKPTCSTDSLGLYRPEIVQIGFQSKAEHGAKILYDCPPNFAGCPLGTV